MDDAPEHDGSADVQSAIPHSVVSVSRSLESFEGPLPPPDVLEGYERMLPGSAERILRMAEQQAEHRRVVLITLVEADTSRARWGLWLGAVVALVFVLAAVVMVLAGQAVAGTIVATADLLSIVGVFVYGTRRRERLISAPDAPPPP